MSEFLVAIGILADSSPALGRVLFASLQLCVLVPLLAMAVKARIVRSHRMQSLLWLMLLADALLGIAGRAPFDMVVLQAKTPELRSVASVVPYGSDGPNVPTPERVATEATFPAADVATPALPPPAPAGVKPPRPVLRATPAWWQGVPASQWISVVWLCGATVLLASLAFDRWRLYGLLRRTDAPSEELLACYRAESGGKVAGWWPALRITDDLETPAIVGVVRPVILVPRWLAQEGTGEQWAWTLRHELTHWRHGDTFGQLVRLVAQAIFFFHPLVWWAGKRWEEAAEIACDRSLLKTEQDAVGYARELCELLGMIGKRHRPLMSAGLFATRSHIGRRIEILVGEPFSTAAQLQGWHKGAAAALFAFLLCFGLGTAEGEPARQENSGGASSGTESAAPPGIRVLQFPEAYSMGTLQIGGERVEARGAVTVPAGEYAYLRLNDAGSTDLTPLADFGANDLQALSLWGTAVQDDQLVYLEGLQGLQRLVLGHTAISDAGVQHIAGLTELRELNLNGTPVGDASMAHLRDMAHLEKLVLNRTLVGDAGLAEIQHLTNLNYLDMWLLDITDEGMQHLQGLVNLQELGIEDTLITDEGLRYLEGMAKLENLNLENNEITDAGLRSLVMLSKLKNLNLSDTYVTDAGMAFLARLSQLVTLQLPVQVGPDGLRAFDGSELGVQLQGDMAKAYRVTVSVTGGGRPVPGAFFSLETDIVGRKKREIYFYTTGPRGTAECYLPPFEGAARLRAYAEGYVTEEIEWAQPVPHLLEIDLASAAAMAGTVVDTLSQPVAGVEVSIPVLGAHNWSSQEHLPHTVLTDEKGRWSCAVVPERLEDFWISLDHRDYATTTYTLADLPVTALHSGEAVLTIADAIGLPGVVVDGDGIPVAGVRIAEMEQWRKNTMRMTGRAATSDGDGYFSIKPIRPGETTLRIDVPGYAVLVETVDVTPGMEPVQLVVAKMEALRGRAVDEKGDALAGVNVYVSAGMENGIDLGRWRGRTDEEGRFAWTESSNRTLSIHFQRDAETHLLEGIRPGDGEQVFVLPFRRDSVAISEGQALIDRYNEAHSLERMGDLVFRFRVEESFVPDAPPKVRRYNGLRMGDGRYRETIHFGVESEADEKPPWRNSWNGIFHVRHGHPAPGIPDADATHYFVGETPEEPAHLIALDWLLIFVREQSPTVKYEVIGYEPGTVTLGTDGNRAMTMHFSDPERLFYEKVVYFNDAGQEVFSIEASGWTAYNGIMFPESVHGHYNNLATPGTSAFEIELLLPFQSTTETFTWDIPEEATVVYEAEGEAKTVLAAELDRGLMEDKAYLSAVAVWEGGR